MTEVERLIRAFAETTNDRDYDRLQDILTEDFTWRTPAAPGGEVHGLEATREVIEQVTGGFPDFHAEPEKVFVEGNEGIAVIRFTGTHEGAFMDIPPTNREVELVGTTRGRVDDGQLAELHDVVNMQELLDQLGVTQG